MAKLKKGVLIVFEGIDGAGKSTQAEILLNKLDELGYSVVYFREPSDSKWGQEIKRKAQYADSLTPQEELELFQKDREENVKNNLEPSLRRKDIIVLDRYYFSSIAYQGVRGLNPEYVERLNEEIAPKPDLLIILDILPSESLKRIRATRKEGPNHFERNRYLEKVRQLFLKQFQGRPYVAIIDGDGSHSEKEISACLWSLIEPIVREAEEKEFGRC